MRSYFTALLISALAFVGPTVSALAYCNPNIGCFGALAAGTWNDEVGIAHVAAGAAWNISNEMAAGISAINKCTNSGGYNCRAVRVFSHGDCGFIATGTRWGGLVRWGSGGTIEAALAACSQGGFDCLDPIGGCTAASNNGLMNE